jgi:IS4 transposase
MCNDRTPAGNSVYVAIAGEVVNRRSVLLRNLVLNGQENASNPLLHIHANRCNTIEDHIHSGVLEDKIIEITVKVDNKTSKLRLRKIRFYDRELKREFEFLTNLFEMRADLVAAIYKLRWQIELLFKQLKQNFPLKYFLGDNENAIKIQIYCVLIANLLMTAVQKMLKRSWAFSNLVSFCKIHLFNYIHLLRFLENPDKYWQKEQVELHQLSLF